MTFRCWLRGGHNWMPLGALAALKKGAPMYQCSRCGEIGWLV